VLPHPSTNIHQACLLLLVLLLSFLLSGRLRSMGRLSKRTIQCRAARKQRDLQNSAKQDQQQHSSGSECFPGWLRGWCSAS
jgi:hypothetical protein